MRIAISIAARGLKEILFSYWGECDKETDNLWMGDKETNDLWMALNAYLKKYPVN